MLVALVNQVYRQLVQVCCLFVSQAGALLLLLSSKVPILLQIFQIMGQPLRSLVNMGWLLSLASPAHPVAHLSFVLIFYMSLTITSPVHFQFALLPFLHGFASGSKRPRWWSCCC